MHTSGTARQKTGMGSTLQQLREQRDWSQATLARRARLGVATIARIENEQINARTGKVDIPKSTTLRKIAQALGDGNAERTRQVQRALFDAAGYGADEEPDETDAATEIARLRERVEALEQQVTADPRDIEQQLWRLLDSYTPEKRQAAIGLMQQALERYTQDATPRPAASVES